MPKKNSLQYVCTNCGASSSVWSGKCPNCDEWNTLQEEAVLISSNINKTGSALPVVKINVAKNQNYKRLETNFVSVDKVLGGGVVPGSVTLIAGEPGIGKSTLMLQIASLASQKASVLYASGEESAHQISSRAARLGILNDQLDIVSTNSADDIAKTILEGKYSMVIVDSIQTVSLAQIASAAGSVSQITNSTNLLTETAKQTNTAIMLVGHVTKEGSIAGPKVLEHTVDTVLQLEGDRYGGFKLLRSVKNRFGPTSETGIFEMAEDGLKEVVNPSAALLEERQVTDGSIVLATMEGSRALLVEVQALVNKTSYGYPKRAASGIELNRLNLLIAMLERRTKLQLGDQDVYVNVVGGIKINDPGADLAISMAIASAAKGMQLKTNAVVYGELGLSGEVRHVPFSKKRLDEATKLGFELAIGPSAPKNDKSAILKPVKSVREALNTYLEI